MSPIMATDSAPSPPTADSYIIGPNDPCTPHGSVDCYPCFRNWILQRDAIVKGSCFTFLGAYP